MSLNPYPVFSVSESDKSEQIKDRIALLIKLYVKHPNHMLAEAVVKDIVVILTNLDHIKDIKQRCLFRQLEMHWRCLYWLENVSIQKTTFFNEQTFDQNVNGDM